jgi:hypothetical protein
LQRTNDAALKLTALAKALPRSEAVDAFVSHEIARGELAIGRPPALPDVDGDPRAVAERARGLEARERNRRRRRD